MVFWLLLFHLLGACVWVGGHVYLVLRVVPVAVRTRDSTPLLAFEASFEKLGMSALAVQIATGLTMAKRYLPDWGMWGSFDSSNPTALLVTLKLTWLLLTIMTAISAQVWVVPKVRRQPLDDKLRLLFIGHIVAITVWSLGFVVTGLLFRTGFAVFNTTIF